MLEEQAGITTSKPNEYDNDLQSLSELIEKGDGIAWEVAWRLAQYEDKFGEDFAQFQVDLATATRRTESTIRTWLSIGRAFPKGQHRPALSMAHHNAVLRRELSGEKRQQLLDHAEAKGLNEKQLREEARKESGCLAPDKKEETEWREYEYDEFYTQLKPARLSELKDGTVVVRDAFRFTPGEHFDTVDTAHGQRMCRLSVSKENGWKAECKDMAE